MKKIALVSQKGGVGKTTLAVNCAVFAQQKGLKTALFDLDTQESAVQWSARRQSELPHIEFLTERRLAEALAAAEAHLDFALAFIDTPPSAGPEAYTAAEAADLLLIPCGPSLIELDAIRRTAQLVKSVRKPAFVVLNAAPPGATNLLDDARAMIEDKGLAIAPYVIRERKDYRAAWPLGKAVVETEPVGKAASEISALMEWVLALLQVRTPAPVQKFKRAANG